jgi:2-C-methyl-D-erythritol 4-phosphate cytidylyltransferase
MGANPPAWAIVVAAGQGTRFGARKQYAALDGRPLVSWALEAARRACAGVVLVLPAEDLPGPAVPEVLAGEAVPVHRPPGAVVAGSAWDADVVVAGGVSRSDSVRAGLAAVPEGVEVIAVHDAARPLAGPGLWQATIAAVSAGADAAIPTIPVVDTVKSVQQDGSLVTVDRNSLWAVQTPQAFRAAALRGAHAARQDATDDASLVEARGGIVVAVAGHPRNLKVTHPDDLLVVSALLPAFREEIGAGPVRTALRR